jgi:hypothetical protein
MAVHGAGILADAFADGDTEPRPGEASSAGQAVLVRTVQDEDVELFDGSFPILRQPIELFCRHPYDPNLSHRATCRVQNGQIEEYAVMERSPAYYRQMWVSAQVVAVSCVAPS